MKEDIRNLALLTDLYELTMMQGYYFKDYNQRAVFDLFFRSNPFEGGFTIFAGLQPAIEAILNLKFTDEEISYLESLKLFKPEFLNYLYKFKFSGNIYAFDEGSIVFPNEPVIRIESNIIECQLIESLLLNFINFQSLIATKAARVYIASKGGIILEFGLRRAQGIDGAISATRAAFIGGASATSNVLAGKILNIPVAGTMAHSWIMKFNSELEAFENYAELYPNNTVLLVDTYDTLKSGIPNAIKVFKKLKEKGIKKFGIRIDSGDLEYLSKEARRMLDEAGLNEAKIYASNELDEYIIEQLIENNSPIDAWGVGTKLVTGDKTSALSGVYKIVAKYENNEPQPCIKISNNPEKITNPGIKNIFRFYDKNNFMIADLIILENEERELVQKIEKKEAIKFNHPSTEYSHFILNEYSSAEKCLKPWVIDGKISREFLSLQQIQNFVKEELKKLHPTYKRFLNPHIYKVSLSNKLKELKFKMIKEHLNSQ